MTNNIQQQHCQAILNSSSDLFLLVDFVQHKITGANKAVTDLLGYSREDLLYLSLSKLFNNYSRQQLDIIFQNLLKSNSQSEEFKTVFLSKSGNQIPVDIHLNTIEINDVVTVVIAARDVSIASRIESSIASLARMASTPGSNIFYQECVKTLASIYQVKFAFIGLLTADKAQILTQVVWAGDQFSDNFQYALKGTPCSDILDKSKALIPYDAAQLYPDDELLSILGVESYYGAPLVNSSNELIGIVSIMDSKPMELTSWASPMLGIYAARIAAELEVKINTESLVQSSAKLEQVVDERTSQLRIANKELEAFSYSISHDLRAPLRSISGFAEALYEEYKSVLDDTGLDYLERVMAGGERMGRLIDDLLALSRITRTVIVKSEVNLSKLAAESIETLCLRSPDKVVTLNINPDIMGNGDPGLIGVVISNLINNAWKYSQKTQQVNIEFGADYKNGETVYYVQDNGIGFNMQYVDSIFNAFQRLHSSKDYEGTGIGLATVQRIIHRHGGQVWAKSVPDQGSTFYFTLH